MSGKAPSARPRPSTSSERVHPFVGHRGHQRRGGGGDYDVYDCTTCSFLPPISVSHRSINLVCSAEGAASAEHEERERERERERSEDLPGGLYACICVPFPFQPKTPRRGGMPREDDGRGRNGILLRGGGQKLDAAAAACQLGRSLVFVG